MNETANATPLEYGQDETERDLIEWLRAANLAGLYNSLAHELRGPLNAMSMNLEMLKHFLNDTGNDNRNKTAHYTGVLAQGIAQLDRQLTLFFAQFASMRTEDQPLPLQKLLIEIEKLASVQAQTQGVAMTVIAMEPSLILQNHVAAWRQAILHLIVNALDGMTAGEDLVIEIARLGRQIQLKVCNTATNLPQSSIHATPGLRKVEMLALRCGGNLKLHLNQRAGDKSRACRELTIPLIT